LKLLLITDAKIADTNAGKAIFNSIAYELKHLNGNFSECEIIGLHGGYSSDMIVLNPSKYNLVGLNNEGRGFKGFSFAYLINLFKFILLKVPKYDVIHVRGPGIPMFYGLLVSMLFPGKKWWFKYANNWNENGKSLFWDVQKKMLGSFFWIKVTVNGNWAALPKHIVCFENPCVSEMDRLKINQREINSVLKVAFVGRLTREKGVTIGYQALLEFKSRNESSKIEYIVLGEGEERRFLDELNLGQDIVLHGLKSKNFIIETLKDCDLLVLPTTSPEGFPKVIAEAMSVGCIPIVTNVSCVEQYIINGLNGFIIDNGLPDLKEQIVKLFENYWSLSSDERHFIRGNAQKTAFDYFTYERFSEKVNSLVLN
jgi:glycosyltransferase involved in cell wall biosynthesis